MTHITTENYKETNKIRVVTESTPKFNLVRRVVTRRNNKFSTSVEKDFSCRMNNGNDVSSVLNDSTFSYTLT